MNSNSKLTIWFLKNRHLLLPLTICVYIIFLFIAIICRIDGLGIFSISVSIIIFFLLMYSRPKQRDAKGGSGGGYSLIEENIEKNLSHFLNEILQPKYIHLLLTIFTKIISYLKNNHEQLSQQEIDNLKMSMESLNEDLKQIATKNHIARPRNTPGR